MPLTDAAIKAAKPKDKPYKLFDARGLFLLVTQKGDRFWRFKYRIHGREKLISLGSYADVPLKRAREKATDARKLLADGIDPSIHRQAERAAGANTFRALAEEWLAIRAKTLAPNTVDIYRDRFDQYILPHIGSLPVAQIKAPEILAALRKIEARGRHETAHRTRAACSSVFRYAVATGRAERDPTADLRGALTPVKTKNFASITDPARLGKLLQVMDSYNGHPSTEIALRLLPLVFVRPGELRKAEWGEFDLDAAEWRIPAERMKMGVQHIVPLSRQAVALLKELQPITGSGRYVFPSIRSTARPMSNNTINAALRSLGYTKDEQTGHGFRSIASTLLNEQGFNADVIELQLAHRDSNKVRSAYNKAERLPERRKMMQAWADYLDGLKSGGRITPIKRGAR